MRTTTEKGRVVYNRIKHEFTLQRWAQIFYSVLDDLDPWRISVENITRVFNIFATLGYFFMKLISVTPDETTKIYARTFMFRFLRRTYQLFFGEEMPLPESYARETEKKRRIRPQ